MKTFKILFFITMLMASSSRLAIAQKQTTSDTLRLGDRVRVHLVNPEFMKITGDVQGLKGDTLWVQTADGINKIVLWNIQTLEVQRGTRTNTGKGALWGTLISSATLGTYIAVQLATIHDSFFKVSAGQAIFTGIIISAPLGALTGAIIGSGIQSPIWIRIPKEQLKFNLSPANKTPATTRQPLTTVPVKKEQKRTQKPTTFKKFSFDLCLGGTISGPGEDIESAMLSQGWDDTSPAGWFSNATAHPFTEKGISFSGQLTYRLKSSFSIGLIVNHSSFGFTIGYHKASNQYLKIRSHALIVGPVVTYFPVANQILGIGGGIVWDSHGYRQSDLSMLTTQKEKGQLGLVLQSELRFPTQSTFFLVLKIQAFILPKLSYGPFYSSYEHAPDEAQLKTFKAKLKHGFVGLGLGWRI